LATTWVLETQTKGTGASVVPLDDVLRKPGSAPVPGFGFRKLDPEPAEAPEAREPRRFKVVDVMTREALADGVDARTAVDVLEDVRSIVDVSIFVWEPTGERWRLLSFAESRMLWEYRERSA
jgi:hypothetical protein